MNQDLPTIITGTPGDDILVGTPGIDLLIGKEGNDRLYGNEGHDFLLGGAGFDWLYGGEGHDFLIGGAERDWLYGGEGHDLLIGGEGNDFLFGGAGVDFFDGGEGYDFAIFEENFAITADLNQGRATYINSDGVEVVETLLNIESLAGTEFDDQLIGDAGNNNLGGGAGNDTLIGGAGSDNLGGGAGVDFLDGGEGVDTANFGSEGFGITADLNAETTTYTDDQGNTFVEVLRDIERIRATNFDDQLIGNEENNIFWGYDGNDTLIGGAGGDLLGGGAGVDFYDGGEGIDHASFAGNLFAISADLTQERATFINEAGVEFVETLLNIESLTGTEFDDQLIGDGGNNGLNGENGDDILIGGAGNDGLTGGAGIDFLDGGEGIDTAYFTSESFGITADLNSETASYTDEQGNIIVEVLRDIENVHGTDFDDQLIGNAENNGLFGGLGDDTFIGGEGNDNLFGGAGIDFFDGGEGIDTVHFAGNLFAVNANLTQGQATYINETGVEVVETLLNIEYLVGTASDDQLIGDAGNNILRGGLGDGAGNDTLVGEAGNDGLLGGAGNDTLVGGAGNDGLNGGAGADTFAFLSSNQGIDTIADFNSTEGDIIQISATGFGAGLTPGVLNPDQFIIGSTAADGGDRIIYNDATGALFFDPDGTGTLGQVQFAQLSANPMLTSSDIVVV